MRHLKKILLVRIPEVEFTTAREDLRCHSVASLAIPLGVTYIASVIRSYTDWEVQILDLYAEFYKECISKYRENAKELLHILQNRLLERVSTYNPEIIGFSAPFLFQDPWIRILAKYLKNNHPSKKIYLGGYPTVDPERILKGIPEVDVIFIGEAEKSILEVLNAESKNQDLNAIDGIAYRENKGFSIRRTPNVVMNLDEIPEPAFDLLPLEKYKNIIAKNMLPIMTSRGCPFSCNFCTSFLYTGKKFRNRSIKSVLKEIELMHSKYNLEFLLIRDDNFNLNKKWCKTVLRELIDRRLAVPWLNSSSFHVNSLDEELLDLCKKSGCFEMIFAVESGSQRVLKEIMNKNVDLEHTKKMAEYCRNINLPLQCYFVIGNPGETKQEILQTIDYAKELQAEHYAFSIATPFPGTQYYDHAVRDGLLLQGNDTIWHMKQMDPVMNTKEFDVQWLKDTQYNANIRLNFLENRLVLYCERNSLEKALKQFAGIAEQYSFHAIARLVEGYIYGKLGKHAELEESFNKVKKLLERNDIDQAYSKYLNWDTPPTNAYRKWIKAYNLK